MEIKSFKSVFFYGSTGLCKGCIDYLSNKQVNIIGVVTVDKDIINITNALAIPLLRTDSDVLDLLSKHTDVLLLSIINPYVIPDTILNHPSLIKAINYHDSLLPKYAGVNSTSWAIYNQESFHGVSWHLIASGVDTGDIVIQEQIAIEEGESVDSLNLKCTEVSFKLFKQMINCLDQIIPVKQNLDLRTYYARNLLSDNFAIISNHTADIEIDILIKAFSVPSLSVNRLTIPKVKYNDQYWMVKEYQNSFFTLQNLCGNNQLSLKVHKNAITQVELSSEQLEIINNIKKYETKNIGNILSGLPYESAVTSELMPDSYSSISLNSCSFSQEYIIFLIYAAFAKLLDIGDEITVYFPIEDEEIGKLVDKKALVSLSDKEQLTFKTANDLFVAQISNPIELFKEFDCRYKVSSITAVGVYIGNQTVLPRHQISIVLHPNEIIVHYNKNISNIDISIDALSSLINNKIELNPNDNYSNACFLSIGDYTKVIYEWNNTASDYPEDKLIHELFEEQVELTPDNIALVYEDTRLTYRELNNRANLLAHYLRDNYKIQPDDLVALCLDRSEHMLIAILATLKAGGAYLPLNVDWPLGRVSDVLAQGGCESVLISKEQSLKDNNLVELTNLGYKIIVVEDVLEQLTTSAIKENQDSKVAQNQYNINPLTNLDLPRVSADDVAYVIFTSGSTGVPKGVTISHSGALNTILAVNEKYGVTSSDAVFALSELSFDLSVYDIFGMLCCGGKIVFPEQSRTKEPNYWIELINQHGVTIWNTVPPLADLLVDAVDSNYGYIGSLRLFLLSGDWIPLNLPDKIKSNVSKAQIVSLGGATEGSIWSIWYDVEEVNKDWESIPYGRAMPNQKMYVLNNNSQACPIGVIGEIHIGGVGVALNYWRDEEKTLNSYFVHSELGRLYKTGDLGCWNKSGYIEFKGRKDSQVKIRGYRIELGDIESKLASFPDVKQAVVVALEHGGSSNAESNSNNTSTNTNKYLAGYYVAKHTLDEESILAYMSEHLPEYMVPNVLVHLESLPLTINGKLDRKALPNPEFTSVDNYVAPRNEMEERICEIYAEVLGLSKEQVGIKDDFFRLGGDSIVSIQLVSRLRQKLSLHISVKDIFSHKSVERLYSNVIEEQLRLQSHEELSRLTIKENGLLAGKVELLPIQEWFFSKVDSEVYQAPGHWNQSFLVRVGDDIDQELLRLSIVKLIEYHDAFRLVYRKQDNQSSNSNLTSTSNIDKVSYIQEYLSLYNGSLGVSEVNELASKVKLNYLDLSADTYQREVTLLSSEEQSQYLNSILTSWQDKFVLDYSSTLDILNQQSSNMSQNDESSNLLNSLLFSVGLIDGYADGSSRVYFALHHLLVDAVSWRIIAHDLGEIYTKLAEVKAVSTSSTPTESSQLSTLVAKPIEELLGAKGTSYRQWVNLVKSYPNEQAAEVSYWNSYASKDSLSNYNKQLLSKIESEYTHSYGSISLSLEQTKLLLTDAKKAYHTEINDLLLSAFALALTKSLGTDNHYVTLEGHGREELSNYQDITRTVGWFTSMYPVALPCASDRDLHQTILAVKESVHSILNKGIGYGALFGYTDTELPRISFNYLGQFDNQDTTQAKTINMLWQVVGEPSGISMSVANHDSNIINANGMVSGGVISFGISSKLSQAKLDTLLANFKTALENVIEYASKLDRSYLSSSDVGNIVSQDYLNKLQDKQEISHVYLANSLQQGFIYHALSHGAEDTAYRVQMVFDYHNELDVELLRRAWQLAVNKYPALRLRFAWDDELVQIIDKHQDIEWHYHDISNLETSDSIKAEQTAIIDNLVDKDRARVYELDNGNLLRVYLIKLMSNHYSCIMSSHHAILDGWSNPRLFGFVHESYIALVNNKEVTINVSEEQAYTNAQTYLQHNQESATNFWDKELTSLDSYPDLSGMLRTGKDNIDLYDYKLITERREESLSIIGEHYTGLKDLASSLGVTANAILQYAWHKLQSIYGNSTSSILGMTVSGRNLPIDNIEESVGLYINTLPVIFEHAQIENRQLSDELTNLQDKINNINSHSNVSLSKLQGSQGSSKRMFNTLFVYENYPTPKGGSDNQIKIEFRTAIEELDYPLGVTAYERDNEFIINLQYAGELFTEDTINKYLASYTHLLRWIAKHKEAILKSNYPLSKLNYLSTDDYTKVIYEWNNTASDYPEDKLIHELFEEQVELTPDNIALVYEDTRLTYRELNNRANLLAHYLRDNYKIQPDDLVALCLDRSEHMLIAILATLKAGGAYVPLDQSYPDDRISYILEDTKARVLLTNELHVSRLSTLIATQELGKDERTSRLEILAIDSKKHEETITKHAVNHGGYHEVSDSHIARVSNILSSTTSQTSQHLAYVIYTSGTTGKPKGVMIGHSGCVSLIVGLIDKYQISQGKEKFILFANYVFDASVEQIWLSLSSGSELHVISHDDVLNGIKFSDYVFNHGITHLDCTPSYLDGLSYDKLMNLQRLISGGEGLSISLLNNLSKCVSAVYNVYGPTENTITSLISLNSTNIGRPISNAIVYILDSHLSPLPIGAIGELYIGGAGVARGYLNNEDLTREKFIANPFQSELEKQQVKNARLYKTGDLVRYLPDGNIEYVGRNDFQVKIRGYRIELGDIESKLASFPDVKQAVVVALEHGGSSNAESNSNNTSTNTNKYLAGYYVAKHTLDEESILAYMSEHLPEYMVPNVLVHLESLPLTINGKLDRKALPNPEFTSVDNYVAPRNEMEERICEIYAEVLGLSKEQVGIKDDFFRLGGNSILAIKLISKLKYIAEFSELKVADIFKYKTSVALLDIIYNDKDAIEQYKLQKNLIKHQLSDNSYSSYHEVAVIGVAGSFGGADNLAELWNLLESQVEGVKLYSIDECAAAGVSHDMLQNPNYIPVAGKVKNIEYFDPSFWGISLNEAKQLDPQIRKFLEQSWNVLESSGYSQSRSEHNIGVFAGSGSNQYFIDHVVNGELSGEINLWDASSANSKDALATKVAYLLGLNGPANAINTACSTGLVTIVEACQKLQLGVCDMALAGGVSLSMPDQIGYVYQEGMIMSKDGHCRTFDKGASGTTGGEGIGVVLLKRLDDAIRDNDKIIAVVKGYATNNDGNRKSGYTAPSVVGQSECIINAQRLADVDSSQIDYVECHGTATNLGDPIEVQALHEAFKYNNSHNKVPSNHKAILGAIKANIGHTDSAAGAAGFIKACLMLQHNTIPGQANFVEANPELHLDKTNFEIITTNREWLPKDNAPRLIGVSSFGVGGTNAHVIIGDYNSQVKNSQLTIIGNPTVNLDCEQINHRYVIQISAKNRVSLIKYKEVLADYLSKNEISIQNGILKNITYTLQEKREHFNYRRAYAVSSVNDLISTLRVDSGFTSVDLDYDNKLVFMFTGQGSQYVGMAKELYTNEYAFKEIIDKCIAIANKYLPVSLYDVMYVEEISMTNKDKSIDSTNWTQISLFVIEYSLAKYLELQGVKADAYIGHSIGEYVAATLCNVFTLNDAIKLVISRGNLMQAMPSGNMLAINSDKESVENLIKEFNCEIAVINSLEDIVASGLEPDIDALKFELDKQSIASLKLNTSHAYHSRLMGAAARKYKDSFVGIKISKPNGRFISNISGGFAGVEVITADYWSNQLRNTVNFAGGVATITKSFNNQVSFIEVGPGKGLCSFVNKYKKQNKSPTAIQSIQMLASLKEISSTHESKESHYIKTKEDLLALLWQYNIIKSTNSQDMLINAEIQLNLPTYQFNSQKCWIEKVKERGNKTGELILLPEGRWLNTLVWSSVYTLQKIDSSFKKLAKSILFIRQEHLNFIEVQQLSDNNLIVIVDHNYNQPLIKISSTAFIRVNPNNEKHFKELSSYLNSCRYSSIVHASSLDINFKDLDDSLAYGFFSLFMIREHILANHNFNNLIVLTNNIAQITGQNVINPVSGAMVGAVRNLNHENLDLDAKIIDVGSLNEVNHFMLLDIMNNQNYYKSENLLAVKFDKLWVESIQPILSKPPTNEIIANDDVILVTGGLGGVGLSITERISQKKRCVFILVSRNGIDHINTENQRKFDLLDQIRLNGSTVEIRCFDIGDKDSVIHNISMILAKYNDIKGVIHTAGVEPLMPNNYKLEVVKDSFKGKVYGIDNLLKALNKTPLKFVVCTSSLASLMGDINRFEYCASNSYLDYLGLNKEYDSTRFISINWPGWSDVGMVINHAHDDSRFDFSYTNQSALHKLMHLNSVDQKIGTEIFYNLINQTSYSNIAVSKIDINKTIGILFKNTLNDDINKASNLVILEDSYTDIEYQIALIFADVLGLSELSLHDNFFRLGGNSILSLHLLGKLKKQDINIKLNDLIVNNSVYLIARVSVSVNDDDIIIPLRLHNSIDNVYFIHAVGGSVIGYKDIVEELPDTFNYYGIQNINIYGKQLLKIETLEELATIYVEEILLTKQGGRIILGGSSMGGTIAYEVAVQLKDRGFVCEFIFMLDSWATFSDSFRQKENFIKEMDRQQRDYLENLTNISIDEGFISDLYDAQWNLMQLLTDYLPKNSDIKIILFKAITLNDIHATNVDVIDNHWAIFNQNIIVHETVGDHVSIMMGKGKELIIKELSVVLA